MAPSAMPVDIWVAEEHRKRYAQHGHPINWWKFFTNLKLLRPLDEAAILAKLSAMSPPGTFVDDNPIPNKRAKESGILEVWIHQQYHAIGFTQESGFIGYKKFTSKLTNLRPHDRQILSATINRLKHSGKDPNRLPDPHQTAKEMKDVRCAKPKADGGAVLGPLNKSTRPLDKTTFTSSGNGFQADSTSEGAGSSASSTDSSSDSEFEPASPPRTDLLSRKMRQLNRTAEEILLSDEATTADDSASDTTSQDSYQNLQDGPDFDLINTLFSSGASQDDGCRKPDGREHDIRHAPLVSLKVLQSDGACNLLPQFGSLGTHDAEGIFLNTNIPFSAFICGVQGSGKSHTTACILENSLIPSRYLGTLKKPLSALVFNYGDFSNNGDGFTISEAAHLVMPNKAYPNEPCAKRVTVLTSPTNPTIRRKYSQLPNVTAVPFKIKMEELDISIMLTLMAVKEEDEPPLYMAEVAKILRDIATNSEVKGFDYLGFRDRLRKCKFNPAQQNMLDLRLGLLESFLDTKNESPPIRYNPGEITIIDMSCPFLDANTACIMFKIALQKYLASDVAGKLVVLDEAHKYMLKVPGAKALNQSLLHTIRMQRHLGARVIISTQEPTLLTELISLCAITIIHRFTSPQWYNALSQHIPMSNTGDGADHLLQKIESLRTGTALVYASNAVLGQKEDGILVKGTGRLLELVVRKRITSDGGQSILASG